MAADAPSKPAWAANLTEGQQNALQGILDQIPTTMGARDAIEGVLDKIAGPTAAAPKWAYYLVDEDGDVYGSNDGDVANAAAESDDGTIVIDAMGGKQITSIVDQNIEEVDDVWTTNEDDGD